MNEFCPCGWCGNPKSVLPVAEKLAAEKILDELAAIAQANDMGYPATPLREEK